MTSPRTYLSALIAEHLSPLLTAESFSAHGEREFVRVVGHIEQRVLLDSRGVSGTRSTYLIYYAMHTCRPPSLNGYTAGARLDGRPWDMSTSDTAQTSMPELAKRVQLVVIPWMRETSTLSGFAGVLQKMQDVGNAGLQFERGTNATLRGDLAEAKRSLVSATKGALAYWHGPDSPARQLLGAIEAGKHMDLLASWERQSNLTPGAA